MNYYCLRLIASGIISTALINSTGYRFEGEVVLGPGWTPRDPHPSNL